MKISFIGMSGAGKSYWSKKLEKIGFVRFCCDDLIEKKLKDELKPLGYSGINCVAKWMGQPYESQYPKTSKKYLTLETRAIQKVVDKIEHDLSSDKNIVIDTTGSVIYIDGKIMQNLCRLTKVVCLDIPENIKRDMYELYIKDPKPVIWGEIFKKRKGETDRQALVRCYPRLLKYRTKKYKQYADVILDYNSLRRPKITASDFLEMIFST